MTSNNRHLTGQGFEICVCQWSARLDQHRQLLTAASQARGCVVSEMLAGMHEGEIHWKICPVISIFIPLLMFNLDKLIPPSDDQNVPVYLLTHT